MEHTWLMHEYIMNSIAAAAPLFVIVAVAAVSAGTAWALGYIRDHS